MSIAAVSSHPYTFFGKATCILAFSQCTALHAQRTSESGNNIILTSPRVQRSWTKLVTSFYTAGGLWSQVSTK